MEKITILGAGAWGSSIANTISQNCDNIILWSNKENVVDEINKQHTNNKYIVNGGCLNTKIKAEFTLEKAVENASIIYIVLPSFAVEETIDKIANFKCNFNKKFVVCTKGINAKSNDFFSDLISRKFNNKAKIAILSGPNFAEEVYNKIPTITTVATDDKEFFEEIKKTISCDFFKVEYFDDMKAVQLCGLVKNITAIICGIAEGLSLGRNTHAGIVLKGIKEIEKLCGVLNCNKKVITTSAGIGDLVLTCSSLKSRNMNFGYKIGFGENIKKIIENSDTTIEGLLNAKSLSKLDEKYNIQNSLSAVLLDIIDNNYTQLELRQIIVDLIE